MFAAYIPAGDMAKYANELPGELKRDFTGTMALLRNPAFQDLLMNYQRAPRTFLIAYETQDTVTSEWLVRGADGKEYKPEDYLTAFARFVHENPAHIEAIRILLDRPQDWSTQALTELKQKLAATPERFTSGTSRKLTKSTITRRSWTSFPWSSTPPRKSSRSDGAERVERASRRSLREKRSHPSSSNGSIASRRT